MNKFFSFLTLLLVGISMSGYADNNLTLWYDAPAYRWNKALPIGNGRIAAMVFGNPVQEEFQLNEETISKGSPYQNYNPNTHKYLDNLRQLIFSGRSQEAQELATEQIIGPRPKGFGAPYQPAGSLLIRFADHKKYSNMKRELKLDSALSVVTYDVGKVSYREEAFTSFTDQLLIVRYTASKKGKLNFDATISHPDTASVSVKADGQYINLNGTTQASARDVPGKVNFRVCAKVVNKGGKYLPKAMC